MSWPPFTLLTEIMAASPRKTDYGDGQTSEDYYALYGLYANWDWEARFPVFDTGIDSLNLNNFVSLPAPGVQSISKAFQSNCIDSSTFTSTPSIIPYGLTLVCGGKERATASNSVDSLLHTVHALFLLPLPLLPGV